MAVKPAVFVDKDGTLLHDISDNIDLDKVSLREGALSALRRLQVAGYALVLVSNQPGVALGRFEEARLADLWDYLQEELDAGGVRFEAFHYCPHHPQGTVRDYSFPVFAANRRPGFCCKPQPSNVSI